MKKLDIKIILPHLKAIVIFILISFLYFSPGIFEGKTVLGGDSRGGPGKDVNEYFEKTGEISHWSNNLFSGMPSYQLAPVYQSKKFTIEARNLYSLYLPVPVQYVFIMLLGFYILMLVYGARTDIAILGAIGYAFSSYFFILIEAGHIWKLLTLAFIPPTIAGLVMTYRGKYLAGGLVLTIFLAFQIVSNHVQMTYYSLFIVAAYVIYAFVCHLKKHTLPKFFKASAVCCVAALIALALNLPNLYHTWEYSQESIRGKSELTHDVHNKTDNGVDRDYMVMWSYGLGETWTLLIPDVKGGASGYLGNNEAIKKAPPQFQQVLAQQNQYWGDQPFTAGPVYAGAFFVTLFVMGLFLLRTKLKWYLLAVLLITVFLSWGKNFMWFTNLFADYFPMYAKFRSVSSILIVAEFIIPFLAILMLIEIVKDPRILVEKKKEVWISFGLTGGMALLFALLPGVFFNFLSTEEANAYLPQAAQNPQISAFIESLENLRMSIFRSDAWRSVIIIAIGGILLRLYVLKKLKTGLFVGLLIALCLIDMWGVNKRYLNEKSFISRRQVVQGPTAFYPKTAANLEILKDTTLHYRVFNTTVSSFNDATTSVYHNSVGGYHAAKLRRYQELIEHHLSKGNMDVFNMLNTRYFIVGKGGQPTAQYNPNALGDAWFIQNIQWVDNADEEINALTNFNPAITAIADKRFQNQLPEQISVWDSAATITLQRYVPNEFVYHSSSSQDGVGVFSEIYYPHGWTATIDGQPVEISRVNYVLRAIPIPAGEHEIVFTFKPQSVKVTEEIAYAGIFLFLLFAGLYLYFAVKKRKVSE